MAATIPAISAKSDSIFAGINNNSARFGYLAKKGIRDDR
jgi:hypothetical protein